MERIKIFCVNFRSIVIVVQKDQTLLNIHAPPSCAFVNNEIVLLPWEIKNSYVLGIVFSIDRFKQALTTLKKIISIVINFGGKFTISPFIL